MILIMIKIILIILLFAIPLYIVLFPKRKNNFKNISSNKNLSNKNLSNTNLSHTNLSNKNLDQHFSKSELELFKKYKKFSNTIHTDYGQVTICPSKHIDELPQITWNGYFINNLLIYPKFRGQGNGIKLIKQIINKGRKEGKLHLISQVKQKNIKATALHDKVGFKRYFTGVNDKREVVIVYVYYL